MQAEVRRAVEAALGARVLGSSPVSGGDINEAWCVELADRRRVFVKSNQRAPAGMFDAEARGLGWLGAAGALRVPAVLAVGEREGAGAAFLALEWLAPAPRRPGFEEALGRGLALLHRSGAPGFGLSYDNFIGRLPQRNTPSADWESFYRDQRLGAQLERSVAAGLATERLHRGFDRLFARLPELLGPPEPAARLHGDLWAGNLHTDEHGAPCLIDPAVYGGHREVDLAMMMLFGGFGARCFAAYREAFPLAEGHEARVALYQLYPLLVHANLFGGGYLASVERTLSRLV